MKKVLAIVFFLSIIWGAVPSLAEDADLFTFAGIPVDTPYDQMALAIENATGVHMSEIDSQLQSVREPAITHMQIPVNMLIVDRTSSGHAILSVSLQPFELDGYADGSVALFDDGLFSMLRTASDNRFGVSSRMHVSFLSSESETAYRIGDVSDLDSILTDVSAWMFRNAYDQAVVSIYKRNVCEQYVIWDVSDPSLYGNISIAVALPYVLYSQYDVDAYLSYSDYITTPVFPLHNGTVRYQNDF